MSLLTVEQASKRLGLKEATLRAWILRRKIAYAKIGKKSVRIPEEEIERIIQESMIPVRAEAK